MNRWIRGVIGGVFFLGVVAASQADAALPVFPVSAQPAKKLFVGEKMVFTIRYFAIPVGKATGEVKEITSIQGRRAYHIVVRVQSTPVVDLIHKVRGEHHTYLDTETLSSLRYEIRSAADTSKIIFFMTIDPVTHAAEYHYPKRGTVKKVKTLPGSQDRLSLGYSIRTMDLDSGKTYFAPVQTEQQNWQVRLEVMAKKKMKIKNIGEFEALEVIPTAEFVATLKERGAVHGWLSQDERRIPLLLTAKAPVFGTVTVTLSEYQPGRDE